MARVVRWIFGCCGAVGIKHRFQLALVQCVQIGVVSVFLPVLQVLGSDDPPTHLGPPQRPIINVNARLPVRM